MTKCTLIRFISFLQLIRHDIAMSQDSPCFTIVGICRNSFLQIHNSLRITFLLSQHSTRLCHSSYIIWIDGKDSFKGVQSALAIIHGTLQDTNPKPNVLLRGGQPRGEIGLHLKRSVSRILGHYVRRTGRLRQQIGRKGRRAKGPSKRARNGWRARVAGRQLGVER